MSGWAAGYRRTVDRIAGHELPPRAAALLGEGWRLALVAGHDDGDSLRAVYLFTAADPDRRIELHVPLDRAAPQVPSLAGLSFPAGRFEREMADLFGIVPVDHPLPRRLVRHFHWPAGWYSMLGDAGDPPSFGDVDGPYPFRTVEGVGVFEIPVGPVHAGMIEPGHFRFSVVGETILNLKARLWFVHKGLEKLFQGRRPDQGVELAERVSGDTAVGHNLAFCQAIEDAWDIAVPPEARRLRAVLLELERLYNHVGDVGALCNDVGYSVLTAHAHRVREQLMRVNDAVTGHRLLRGAIHPGGARVHALPDLARLAGLGAEVTEIVELALSNSVVADRFTGTAVLTHPQARDLGALGYVGRASGIDVDARRDHPGPGGQLWAPGQLSPPAPHAGRAGDVLSRFLVRAEEVAVSVAAMRHLVEELGGSTAAGAPGPGRLRGGAGSGVGIVEGWRGTIVHRVEISAAGTLARVKIVDPSFFNWPALPVALADTIVPDFPLANKSFNLSYAGNDL